MSKFTCYDKSFYTPFWNYATYIEYVCFFYLRDVWLRSIQGGPRSAINGVLQPLQVTKCERCNWSYFTPINGLSSPYPPWKLTVRPWKSPSFLANIIKMLPAIFVYRSVLMTNWFRCPSSSVTKRPTITLQGWQHLPSWLSMPAAQQPTNGPGYNIKFKPHGRWGQPTPPNHPNLNLPPPPKKRA